MIAWVTLVLLLALGLGLWLLTGRLERLAELPEAPACEHEATTYSVTTGVTRCIGCGTPVEQEFWD